MFPTQGEFEELISKEWKHPGGRLPFSREWGILFPGACFCADYSSYPRRGQLGYRLLQLKYLRSREWILRPAVFLQICREWDTPDVDWFVSQHNHKLPVCVSPGFVILRLLREMCFRHSLERVWPSLPFLTARNSAPFSLLHTLWPSSPLEECRS